VLHALVSQGAQVDAAKGMLPRAEQDGPNGEMQLVDQARGEILADRRHAAAQADVTRLFAAYALPSGAGVEVWPMPDEASLREFARFAIRNGTLPRRDPARIWAGPSVGALCTVCEKPITRDQLEYEVEFPPDGGNPGLDQFHFHLQCFAAWEVERTKLEAS
jgi:hypothetical protein